MQRIPEEMIERIAAANDIVEVIGSYFPLKRAGPVYKALCPFHQEKTPSFTVNPHRQLFKCFGCGAGGSVYRFLMNYRNLSFVEAARFLAERAGIPLIEQELSPEDQARVDLRRRLLALHADVAAWFHRNLMRLPSAERARDYLKRRGLGAEVAKSWQLGYAPDGWDHFGDWAQQKGYTVHEILKSGLVSRRGGEEEDAEQSADNAQFYDRFRDRVMIPIYNTKNEIVAFSGRVLDANAKAAKYVNSPETMLFTKGKVLFGIQKTVRALIDKKSAIVCEGQIDLITAYEAGVTNVIASQGTAFTDHQVQILKRYVSDEGEVVLCFDSDAAGAKATEKSLEMLLAARLGVRVLAMPPGEDPDSLVRREGGPAFLERVAAAKDFFTFQLERLAASPEFQTPKGRANIGHRMAGWISLIEDAAYRETVMGQATSRLEISMREFSRMMARVKQPQKDTTEPVPENVATPLTDPNFRLLALAALHNQEACEWLRAAPFRVLLERETEAGLVMQILESAFVPGDRGSQQAFLATLSAADEATISGLLSEPPPAEPLAQASDCWNALARRQIQRHLEALQARLRAAEINLEERLKIMTEVTELTASLREIPPPSRPFVG